MNEADTANRHIAHDSNVPWYGPDLFLYRDPSRASLLTCRPLLLARTARSRDARTRRVRQVVERVRSEKSRSDFRIYGVDGLNRTY